MSTDHRPSVDQLLTDTSVKYRPTIDQLSASVGEMSAKCRWTKSYIGRDTSETTIDRVSTECRPTIDRLSIAISTDCRPSVDRVSTYCRPSVDRLSTECRPLYRPISRSTLPTVNKIPFLSCLPWKMVRLFIFFLSPWGKHQAYNRRCISFKKYILMYITEVTKFPTISHISARKIPTCPYTCGLNRYSFWVKLQRKAH